MVHYLGERHSGSEEVESSDLFYGGCDLQSSGSFLTGLRENAEQFVRPQRVYRFDQGLCVRPG